MNNAFLNGTLDETIFMKQPEGVFDPRPPHRVCLSKKALYGLKQATRVKIGLDSVCVTIRQSQSRGRSIVKAKRAGNKATYLLGPP